MELCQEGRSNILHCLEYQAPELAICKQYYSYRVCRYQEIFVLKVLQEMFRIQWVGAL